MSQTTSLLAGAEQDILPETIPERADHVPPFARSLGTLLRLLGRPVSMPLLLSGILGIYAITVTVHALYNLLISAGGAGEILGYCLPAMLIAGWKLWPVIGKDDAR